jgi:hypothetical protein
VLRPQRSPPAAVNNSPAEAPAWRKEASTGDSAEVGECKELRVAVAAVMTSLSACQPCSLGGSRVCLCSACVSPSPRRNLLCRPHASCCNCSHRQQHKHGEGGVNNGEDGERQRRAGRTRGYRIGGRGSRIIVRSNQNLDRLDLIFSVSAMLYIHQASRGRVLLDLFYLFSCFIQVCSCRIVWELDN